MRHADLRVAEALRELRADFPHASSTLANDTAWNLVSHRRRWRSGTIRIRKNVDVRQRRALEIRDELFEVLVRLAGESDDDVAADRRVLDARADIIDERRVVLDRVRPAHAREDAVARMLQRQVKMRREAIGGRDEIHDLARTVHRLERGDAKQNVGWGLEKRRATYAVCVERPEQLVEGRARFEIGAVRAEMDARERDLLESCRDNAIDFSEKIRDRHAARPAARRRDDAVGTRFGAAGLHAQRECGSAGDARLNRRATGSVADRNGGGIDER